MEPIQKESFRVVNRRHLTENKIFILLDSPSFLEDKWNLIREYARKVDPRAPIASTFVLLPAFKTRPEDLLNMTPAPPALPFVQEYKHMVALHDIFPRIITTMYGDHPFIEYHANCHSTALMMAGVLPGPYRSCNYFNDLPFAFKLKKVSLESLSSGDFVNIGHHVHSFVFLDHDISLTVDGRGAPLLLKKTESILTHWGIKSGALKTYAPENRVEIYRKEDGWTFSEDLMVHLIPLYQFGAMSFWSFTGKDRLQAELRTTYQKVSSYFENLNTAEYSRKEISDWHRFFKYTPIPSNIEQTATA